MATEPDLTHFNEKGDVHMVDVSAKDVTDREAVAEGRITMSAETLDLIQSGGHKKGDVLGIARTAGIMGAKKTSELVPLCHPLMLTKVSIELELERALHRNNTHHRANRRRDGGVDCRAGDAADHLRYVQGRGPGNGNAGHTACPQVRGQIRRVEPGPRINFAKGITTKPTINHDQRTHHSRRPTTIL